MVCYQEHDVLKALDYPTNNKNRPNVYPYMALPVIVPTFLLFVSSKSILEVSESKELDTLNQIYFSISQRKIFLGCKTNTKFLVPNIFK